MTPPSPLQGWADEGLICADGPPSDVSGSAVVDISPPHERPHPVPPPENAVPSTRPGSGRWEAPCQQAGAKAP